jgi:hypothetical protein
MYKAAARRLIRRNICLLNRGNYAPALAMFAADAAFTFPGQNSWSRQHRIPTPGRSTTATHRGRPEIEKLLRRYVRDGIQMEVEDILVNGPPWNMRVAVQVHHWIPGVDGRGDVSMNRAVLVLRMGWSRIHNQENYEDTELVSSLERGYSVVPVASPGTSNLRMLAQVHDDTLTAA